MCLGSFRFVWFVPVCRGCRWVLSRSSGSPVWIRQDAPCGSLVSFAFVYFVCLRIGCPWVRSGSSGSSGCALGVATFVRVHLVCSGVPWRLLGSFRFVWIVRLRPGSRCVRFCSFGTSGCSLVVAGYVCVRLFRLCARSVWLGSSVNVLRVLSGSSGSSGCAQGVAGFVWFCVFRLGTPWGSLESFGFVCFVREHPSCYCVRSGSYCLFGYAPGVGGFVRAYFVRMEAP